MNVNKRIALRMEYYLESEDRCFDNIPKYADWLEARLVRISDEVEKTDSEECKKITFLRS